MRYSDEPGPDDDIPARGQSRRPWKRIIFLIAGILLVLIGAGIGGYWGYSTYRQLDGLANDGAQHLRDVQALLLAKKRFSFSLDNLRKARDDAAIAQQDFQQLADQVQGDAGLLAVAQSLPQFGKTARALPPLTRMALDAATGTHELLDVSYQLAQGLFQAASSKSPGMTAAQFQQVNAIVNQAQQAFAAAQAQRRQFSPDDLPSQSLRSSLAEFDKLLPTLGTVFAQAHTLGTVAPVLLGVTRPATYLLEIMDSTELRASGGFLGNYGIVRLDQAKITSFSVRDTYLLDRPYQQTNPNTTPPEPYASWWPFSGWGLRDSNLSPDFPTTARLGESELAIEGGGHVDGVIAITPGFIQQLLRVTGPIHVPEYQQTVTPANLEDLIHYYQRHESVTQSLNLPPEDQVSSVEKRFTAIFGRDLFTALQALPQNKRAEIVPIVVAALQDKDLQMYFNDPQAEQLLTQFGFSDRLLSPSGDSLMVVDTNIGAAKANPYIDEQYHDTVVLDAYGGATHTLTIQYHYARTGNLYGLGTGYLDHVRVYIPHTAQFRSVSGCPTSYPPDQEVGHTVLACQFFIAYRDYQTITFRWYVPNAAVQQADQWRYNFLVQKQAGNAPLVIITISPPPGAKVTATQSLLEQSAGTLTTRHAILADWPLWVNYTS